MLMKKDLQDMAHSAMTEILIRKIPFLACLNDEEGDVIKGLIVERQFLKNQTILREEDTSNYCYFIFTGKVKVTQVNADGNERILAVHKKGDFFGEMAILDDRTTPATVTAIEDTKIGMVSRDVFQRYLLNQNKVLREIIVLLCGRLREAWSMMKVMRFADAEHRIRAVLKYMADQFGVQEAGGTRIEVKFTHSDMGSFAAMTRETATRMMRRLEKAGEIEITDQKHIVLKPVFYKNTGPSG
jgi:CRP/FNR family transcriptional regulator